jgi:glycosyltransferase involved in cell wall biosynthesis
MVSSPLTAAKLPISVVLPVLNEERNIGEALRSVRWASEIFVVDSGSTDRTVAIAEAHGASVVQFHHTPRGPKKKAWSLRNLPFSNDWALYLDADERVPDSLNREIAQAVGASAHDAYYVDRQFVFRGKELRSARPDWNLRLFRHKLASLEDLGLHHLEGTGDNEIHEHFILDGAAGYLTTPLLHDDYRGIDAWVDRHNRYATWEAHLYRSLRDQPVGIRLSNLRDPVARNRLLRRVWVRLPARPLLRFLTWYVGKRGFLDGWTGFHYSFLMAWYELLISLRLEELEEQ